MCAYVVFAASPPWSDCSAGTHPHPMPPRRHQASNSTDFYMTQIAYRFEGADTTGGVYSFSNAPLAVLEPEPADNLTQWCGGVLAGKR